MSVYEIGLISGLISIFLNYCLGKPGGEFSPYEIFSGYTVWLSIRRLKRIGLIQTYHRQFQTNVNQLKTEHEIISLRRDYHKMLYNAAEPFFTWERAVGMCSVCTGFWIAIISYFIKLFIELTKSPAITIWFVLENVLQLLIIIVISHITIRIVNKIL